MKVVIVGGGVIGCTLAYYLFKTGIKEIVIVEQVSIASGASGKSGGFLAFDWCDQQGGLRELARKSFKLHEDLAKELPHDYLYRKVVTLNVTSGKKGEGKIHNAPLWLDGDVSRADIIGTTKTTAQLHPKLFTEALFKESGAQLVIGKVKSLVMKEDTVKGVCLDDNTEMIGDKVVIAMGAWSPLVEEWIPKKFQKLTSIRDICALKANSIVLDPRRPEKITAQAIFLHNNDDPRFNPEIYPRSNGEVYVCGFSELITLPESTAHVLPDVGVPEKLHKMVGDVSSDLKDSTLKIAQACILPDPKDGLPLIGEMPGLQNLIVAAGHYCWGILNAPATALALSELIVDGKSTSIDLSAFDPKR